MEEDEEDYDKELKPEDMLADEEGHYESEEEHPEAKPREKPVGPPLELEIPLRPPPALPEKVSFFPCFLTFRGIIGCIVPFMLPFGLMIENSPLTPD